MPVNFGEIQQLKDELPGKLVDEVRSTGQVYIEANIRWLQSKRRELAAARTELEAFKAKIDAEHTELETITEKDKLDTLLVPWYRFSARRRSMVRNRDQRLKDQQAQFNTLNANLDSVIDLQPPPEVVDARADMDFALNLLGKIDPILSLAVQYELKKQFEELVDKTTTEDQPPEPPTDS